MPAADKAEPPSAAVSGAAAAGGDSQLEPRRVQAGGVSWSLLDLAPDRRGGSAASPPAILLLHGTGASAASWQAVARVLASRCRVIVPDLPGHAGSSRPSSADGLSLPGMARALAALLPALQCPQPAMLVGHSAGAAIALRLALDAGIEPPAGIVGVNAALLPPQGPLGSLYSPLARLLTAMPGVAPWFAQRASRPEAIERLLQATGSRLGADGVERYRALAADPAHVAATLRMMALWDLQPLLDDLPRLRVPLRLIATRGDRTVPPAHSERIARALRLHGGAAIELENWPALGHLAHEEEPERFAARFIDLLGAAAALRRARRGGSVAPEPDLRRAGS
jgi:magnesium chelatase accessory protein